MNVALFYGKIDRNITMREPTQPLVARKPTRLQRVPKYMADQERIKTTLARSFTRTHVHARALNKGIREQSEADDHGGEGTLLRCTVVCGACTGSGENTYSEIRDPRSPVNFTDALLWKIHGQGPLQADMKLCPSISLTLALSRCADGGGGDSVVAVVFRRVNDPIPTKPISQRGMFRGRARFRQTKRTQCVRRGTKVAVSFPVSHSISLSRTLFFPPVLNQQFSPSSPSTP